jgi:hypothetical protein
MELVLEQIGRVLGILDDHETSVVYYYLFRRD